MWLYMKQNLRWDSKVSKLNIDQNRINLHLLLTGGEGSRKDRLKILRIFINFVKLTERFDIK